MKHSDYDKKDNIRKPAPDLWLESQKEAIRALKPDHKVDVTEAVMQRVATMPLPKATPVVGIGRRVALWAAAACVAGIVASSVFFVNRSVSPVSSSSDLTARLIDVYEYCNDYDDVDYEEEDAYYDNPVTYFL